MFKVFVASNGKNYYAPILGKEEKVEFYNCLYTEEDVQHAKTYIGKNIRIRMPEMKKSILCCYGKNGEMLPLRNLFPYRVIDVDFSCLNHTHPQRFNVIIEDEQKHPVIVPVVEQLIPGHRSFIPDALPNILIDTDLLNFLKEDELTLIYDQKIEIGSSMRVVQLSWGAPNSSNKTITAKGTQEQWIYNGNFVYFENNIVTAIQESH